MIKVLFLIHDLGQGGAEKVLVNLVNHMDPEKFHITVMALFGGGVNEQFLKPHVTYHAVFPRLVPGNKHFMKLLSPKLLHRLIIREHYDVEVSYLEGPSARIISGCADKTARLVSWIHVEQHSMKKLAGSFRSRAEAESCYRRFDKIICVSQYVKNDFCSLLNGLVNAEVLYNTVESDKILCLAKEKAAELTDDGKIRIVAVGTLKKSKGYDRLLRIINRFRKKNYPVHLYILGKGSLQSEIEQYIQKNSMESTVTLLGYQTNPYKYVAGCDLFVCSSYAEGFSTAATEALIVGTPVCTVEVSGMKEMLGENNEYGIVTENSEEGLYKGIKMLLDDPGLLTHYRKQAELRGTRFCTENTVKAVEDMLAELAER